MDRSEINNKARELENILLQYRSELSELEAELLNVVAEYRKVTDQERIRELKQQLNIYG